MLQVHDAAFAVAFSVAAADVAAVAAVAVAVAGSQQLLPGRLSSHFFAPPLHSLALWHWQLDSFFGWHDCLWNL